MSYRWLPCVLFVLLVGCADVGAPVPITRETVIALTPTPTLTPTITPTLAPTETPTTAPTPTRAPTLTPTPVGETSETVDVSYCTRPFGPSAGSRFSARLNALRTDQTDRFDQVIFEFSDINGLLHGTARCILADAWPQEADIGADESPGAAVIAVELDHWVHDDLFVASPLTQTLALTPTGVLQEVSFAANSLESRGALLGVGLSEPRPFRIRVEDSTLFVEILRDAAYPPEDDPLGEVSGSPDALDQSVFFLHAGDVYRLEDGRAQPVLETPELETGLAVSPDGTMLAVCRAPANAESFALPYDVRASLWTMRVDGSDQQLLADVGGCAEPAFAASGRTVAFTVNTAPVPPAVLQVWTVPVVGGDPAPMAAVDEWNRSHPVWLADGRLIYRATSDNGQSILLVRESDGSEREITARLLTGSAYAGIGDFVVNPASGLIAVEALRAEREGADLVLIRANGTQVASEQRGFWQRPLGFAGDELLYLTAECPSEAILTYTVNRRSARGVITPVLNGATPAGIGSAVVIGDALLYVRAEHESAGMRGPALTPHAAAPSSIWRMSLDGTERDDVFSGDAAISDLRVAP